MVADRYAVYSFHLREVKIVGEIGKYTKFHLQQTEKVSRIVKIEITSLAGRFEENLLKRLADA